MGERRVVRIELNLDGPPDWEGTTTVFEAGVAARPELLDVFEEYLQEKLVVSSAGSVFERLRGLCMCVGFQEIRRRLKAKQKGQGPQKGT